MGLLVLEFWIWCRITFFRSQGFQIHFKISSYLQLKQSFQSDQNLEFESQELVQHLLLQPLLRNKGSILQRSGCPCEGDQVTNTRPCKVMVAKTTSPTDPTSAPIESVNTFILALVTHFLLYRSNNNNNQVTSVFLFIQWIGQIFPWRFLVGFCTFSVEQLGDIVNIFFHTPKSNRPRLDSIF